MITAHRLRHGEERPEGAAGARGRQDQHPALELAEKNNGRAGMIDYMVVAGNTTMMHLFYGIDPQHIREEPYIPAATFFPLIRGKSVGLRSTRRPSSTPCRTLQAMSAATSAAGVLVSQMHKQDEVSLFIDIGTNGEIVLGNKDWLVTAACSAGPAFEGSGIKFGMRAMEGAIEEVEIDPEDLEVNYRVIGDVKADRHLRFGHDRHACRDVPHRRHRPKG